MAYLVEQLRVERVVAKNSTLRAYDLLITISDRQAALERSAREERQRLAPAFSPFEFLDTRENGISRVLASLLDPSGNHAQGSRFLALFLEWLGIDWPSTALESARIRTEAPITNAKSTRRIDILITSGARAIAIENKLTASDQEGQLSDYLSHISSRYKSGACLVYLTLETDREASWESIHPDQRKAAVEQGCLLEKSYSDLADLFHDWVRVCDSPMVANFIEGLLRHILKSRLEVEDVESTNELTSEIVKSPDKLSAAFEVYQTQPRVYESLFNSALQRLAQRTAENPDWKLIDLDLAKGKPHGAVIITYHSDASFGVGVAFHNAGYRRMYYGLRATRLGSRNVAPGRELMKAVREVLGKGGTPATGAWPWWQIPSVNDPFFPLEKDYVATCDFWLKVQDGTFADRVFDFAVEIHDHFRKKNALGLLRTGRVKGRTT